ncbi:MULTISPECIES: LysR substrate-binding domain-containing protein [Pseudovibrio]|uniref:LysR substrate-binding domain-containing protein n=1 Tax=Stappiaceae TaxID=2821832 RepID=UPI00236732EA|nr:MULTISPECIES: LysR substrate-binding domain-containing protein [Pseudovibrio]MDD7910108.1 LysR substrate-binding domain-containing protein [Pseudovibrio exalbescens]MDX5592391.1 LysR substrate-binding domain-containing protein [Pseudovibrio sp. SPO723]
MVSLRALHAFSLLAKHGRAARAAEDLGVTPSALTHLLRSLESELGAALVIRDGRGLVLTEEGQRLSSNLGNSFDQIEHAVEAFRRRSRTELRISTLSTVATRWLIPRLPDFQQKHPDIELLISTSMRVVDLDREAYDCAIRLGKGGWPQVEHQKLWQEDLVVAFAPQLSPGNPNPDISLLDELKMLHTSSRRDDWPLWLKAAGIDHLDPSAGAMFESRNMAIQGAVAGMGAIAIDTHFVDQEVQAGHLMVPDWPTTSLETGYWFVRNANRPLTRPVAAFRDWLLEQSSETLKSEAAE